MPAVKSRPTAKPGESSVAEITRPLAPADYVQTVAPLDEILKNATGTEHVTVGEVARLLTVAPRLLTTEFYLRHLPAEKTLIKNGRRWVPVSLIPEIFKTLVERGHLPMPVDFAAKVAAIEAELETNSMTAEPKE